MGKDASAQQKATRKDSRIAWYHPWMRKKHEHGLTHHEKVAKAELIERLVKPELGPCQEWPFARDPNGYGRVGAYGTRHIMFTHRVALENKLGRPLGEGKFACHHCDNPPCCNPKHLYEGNYPSNAGDARVRDRVKFGETHHQSKLTEDGVRQIRKWEGQLTQREMARRLNVHDNTVRDVLKGRTWVRVR